MDDMLKCVCLVLPIGRDQWELVVELHGINFPMQSRTVESMKHKFSTLANQQPGMDDPNIPPHVAKAKEIREAINFKARVSDVNVSEFFVDDKAPMEA